MTPVEQLKSVLCDPEGKCCIAGSDEDRRIVDEALRSLASPSATEATSESVCVPREPTKAMRERGEDAAVRQYDNSEWDDAKEMAEELDVSPIWKAMLAAAPAPATSATAATPLSDVLLPEWELALDVFEGCIKRGNARSYAMREALIALSDKITPQSTAPVVEAGAIRDASRYRWLNRQDNFLAYIEYPDGTKRHRLKCGEPLDKWIDAEIESERLSMKPSEGGK